MEFKLDAHLMALLMTRDCADWLVAHAASGAAPSFNDDNELVFRFASANEGQQFRQRWLLEMESVTRGR